MTPTSRIWTKIASAAGSMMPSGVMSAPRALARPSRTRLTNDAAGVSSRVGPFTPKRVLAGLQKRRKRIVSGFESVANSDFRQLETRNPKLETDHRYPFSQ